MKYAGLSLAAKPIFIDVSALTGEVVALVGHSELSCQKDRNEQQHVWVLQLAKDRSRLSLEVCLLHVRDLSAVTPVHFLWLGQKKRKRGA